MMDYKYIEQLLDSYFACTTTLQEEQILRSFFSQEDVPGHLAQYADLFHYEVIAKEETLGEDFDQRMMARIDAEKKEQTTTGHIVEMTAPRHAKSKFLGISSQVFAPFFKAAAVVAMALTIGRAAEHAIGEQEAEENRNIVAIDPYIKSSDVQQAVRVKDVSQAETKTTNDSILSIATKDEIQ
ncbi:MAG: pyruvate ferredoxin oxidoreductase [Bacteroidaceae bacterium]|nr:pyruvate ferredoxin oxidoreductase [Bacteroidaceae bacterium]